MSRKRKEKPIAPGDAVTVLRHCADGAARMARGVVEFAASGGCRANFSGLRAAGGLVYGFIFSPILYYLPDSKR